MNCLSLNVQGFGKGEKKRWVASLYNKYKVHFLALQEVKMERVDTMLARLVWGNSRFEWAYSPAKGASGGVLSMWDKEKLKVSWSIIEEYFVLVEGVWLHSKLNVMIINIYAPQEVSSKKELWQKLLGFIGSRRGEVLLMGDFNTVKFESERHGSVINRRQAADFNKFIVEAELVDVKLDGYKFTWVHESTGKISKLDRFLASKGLMEKFPNLSGLVLDRHLSDHMPIYLHEIEVDYGPTPFRLFNSWLVEDEFVEVVKKSWSRDGLSKLNSMVKLKYKLKALKNDIKE